MPAEDKSPQKETQDLSKYTLKEKASLDTSLKKKKKVLEGKNGDFQKKLKEKVDLSDIPLEKRNLRLYIFGIVISLAVVLITSILFYLRIKQGNEKDAAVGVVVDEVLEQEEEAVIQLERSEISLEILNGSGISGLAGDTSEVFEELGYDEVETGNADLQEENTAFVSKEKKGVVDVLLEDLKEELDIASVSYELEESDFDAQIILGK